MQAAVRTYFHLTSIPALKYKVCKLWYLVVLIIANFLEHWQSLL